MSARPAARAGDIHACPQLTERPSPHVGGPITDGSRDVFINNLPAARAGDPTTCDGPLGAEVEDGSPGVFINRQPAARVADPAGHGGRVVAASPNVHIGDHGRRSSRGATDPGQHVAPQLAVVLHANYDQSSGVDQTVEEHRRRLTRPGAIVMPNLDIEVEVRNPPVASSTPEARARLRHLDAYQELLRGGDDEVANGVLATSPYGAVPADRVDLVLHPADALRVRVYAAGGGRAIAGVLDQLAGPLDISTTAHRYRVPASALPMRLYLEAVAPAGDPFRVAPRGAVPAPPPSPFQAQRPPGATERRVYSERAPGEVWIQLEHAGAGRAYRDVSLFTIAPFLLVPNTQPVEQLYVVYSRGTHPTAYDLARACHAIFGSGVDVPASASTPMMPHTPREDLAQLASKKLVVLQAPQNGDDWFQDQIVFGYCRAPQKLMHMVVLCKRRDQLALRAMEDLPVDGVSFYAGIYGAGSSIDFGGNIEVSPPVPATTRAMPRDAAGPSIAAHPAAPLGKIIFGDCHPRAAHPETRAFLLAQRVQPVLPIDTSWLRVGHVDEVMTTVPDGRGGFKLLVASADAMTKLLERTVQLPWRSRTPFHRGKYFDLASDNYGEIEIEDLLSTPVNRFRNPALLRPPRDAGAVPTVGVRQYNNNLQRAKLSPIASRLRDGLGLQPTDVLPIPMYFAVPLVNAADQIRDRNRGHTTAALTVGCVNCQVVNEHLLIGRPFGPRLAAADARQVLADVLRELGLGHLSVRLAQEKTVHWSPPTEPLWKVYAYFARVDPANRARVVDALRGRADVHAVRRDCHEAMDIVRQQLGHSPGASWDAHVGYWQRFELDEGPMGGHGYEPTYDVIESFLTTLLTPLGLTLHFIESWDFHIREGNVHCATNTRRTPPDRTWWDAYDPIGPHWSYDPRR